jgi:hypothetical protein
VLSFAICCAADIVSHLHTAHSSERREKKGESGWWEEGRTNDVVSVKSLWPVKQL